MKECHQIQGALSGQGFTQTPGLDFDDFKTGDGGGEGYNNGLEGEFGGGCCAPLSIDREEYALSYTCFYSNNMQHRVTIVSAFT